MNIDILFRISPNLMKIQSDSNLGYGLFFKTVWKIFIKRFPGIFRVLFLHRKTYLLKYWSHRPYWNTHPSVRQSWEFAILSVSPSVHQRVSLSVRQSVSPSVRKSVSPSVRQSGSPSVIEICSPFLTVPRF